MARDRERVASGTRVLNGSWTKPRVASVSGVVRSIRRVVLGPLGLYDDVENAITPTTRASSSRRGRAAAIGYNDRGPRLRLRGPRAPRPRSKSTAFLAYCEYVLSHANMSLGLHTHPVALHRAKPHL